MAIDFKTLKVGDRIRRIQDDVCSVRVGEIRTVSRLRRENGAVFGFETEGNTGWYSIPWYWDMVVETRDECKFKIGDIVRCIEPSGDGNRPYCIEGKLYTVEGVHRSTIEGKYKYLHLRRQEDGVRGSGWDQNRFELVEKAEAREITQVVWTAAKEKPSNKKIDYLAATRDIARS